MTFLQTHNKAFKAEWLKLKHSGMFWLCFGAALFIPLLQTIVYFFINLSESTPDTNRWNGFIESNFRGFTPFFFPIFLVLMMVRLVYLEHRSDTWKLLETQPVPKASLFLAKWEVAAIISLLCLVGLLLFTLTGGFLLQIFKKQYKLDQHSIDWLGTGQIILRFWIASLAIISIQYFFGLLIKSFAWPMSIGLMATIAGSILAGFGVLPWWPYSATILTSGSYEGSTTGSFLLHHEKLSLLWSALFLWLGYQYFVRRTFVKAFFSPATRTISFAAVLVGFIGLSWIVTRPSAVPRYNKTVLAGSIESSKPVANILLLQAPAFDTVMLIPVKNGTFHASTTTALLPGIYYLRAGNYRSEIYFGNKDSLFIELSLSDKQNNAKIKGTRLAENEYLRKNNDRHSWQLTDYAYNYTPAQYAGLVLDEWEAGIKRINSFKTVDNLKPSADFIEAQRKLLALQLMGLVDNYYPQVHAVYYPNDALKYPAYLDRIRREANMNDSSLAMYADFRTFINEQLRTKSGRNDSLYFALLHSELKNPLIRDYLLFDMVQNDVFRIKDSAARMFVLQKALSSMSSSSLKNNLVQKSIRLQNLQRGMKAPNFLAEAINNASFDLGKLANRYVVLDVWATWCIPCKKEAPYFEDLADRYTNEKLAFVSVSIDENKNAWRIAAAGKKGKVLQLWAKNPEEDFGKTFAISSIPRFMLIDPRGNIINADLPPPSDPEFEAVLQREIAFLGNRIL